MLLGTEGSVCDILGSLITSCNETNASLYLVLAAVIAVIITAAIKP